MSKPTRNASPSSKGARPLEFPIGRQALTVNELAARWGCSDLHITNLVEGGHLHAFDVSGGSVRKHWRFPYGAITRFENRNASLFDPETGKVLPENPLPRTPARMAQDDLGRVQPSETRKRLSKLRQCAAVTAPVRSQKPVSASKKLNKARSTGRRGAR